MALNTEEHTRYHRQIIVPEISDEGQEKLFNSKVLLIGLGGLGSPVSIYLAASGIGCLGLVDFDKVHISNLPRQILYDEKNIGKYKVDAAQEKLQQMNNRLKIKKYNEKINANNVFDIIKDYDVIIDGSDNFPTRYLVSDACCLSKKSVVSGSVFRLQGQVTVLNPFNGPCYRCLYPSPPPIGTISDCAEGGVMGPVPGLIGMIQSIEAIKILINIGKPLIGRLLTFDALTMRFNEINIKRDPSCDMCGESPIIHELTDEKYFCGNQKNDISDIDVQSLDQKIQEREKIVLIDVRKEHEYKIVNFQNAILCPLNNILEGVDNLDKYKDKELVLYCHHGERSKQACQILVGRGFLNVKNLVGGIDTFAKEIDMNMDRY